MLQIVINIKYQLDYLKYIYQLGYRISSCICFSLIKYILPCIMFSLILQHIDVIFYYLRKKSKQRSMDQYRYTTVNCLFKSHINKAYSRYYNSHADDTISTQEHMFRAAAVSVHERSIINIINGFSIPAALPWHLVDEVYIPINCDENFHWVLAVVVLKERLIRVYDSTSGSRKRVHFTDIKKLSQILPNYLHDSGFFEKKERTDWAASDAYKDMKTGELWVHNIRLMWSLLKTTCNE